MTGNRDSKREGPLGSPATQVASQAAGPSNGSESAPTQMYFATRGAAAYVDMTPKQLEHLRCRGGGPVFYRVGKLVRYSRAALDAWMTAHPYRSTSHEVQS